MYNNLIVKIELNHRIKSKFEKVPLSVEFIIFYKLEVLKSNA